MSTTAHRTPDLTSSDRGPTHSPPLVAALTGLPVLIAVVVGLVMIAMALPAVKARPHDLPIGVAAPAPVAAQVTGALAERDPGAFAVTTFADQAALEAATRDRDVYGGVVVAPTGVTVVTASAASVPVAQALTELGRNLAANTAASPTAPAGAATQPRVVDVAPFPGDDPRGAGLAAIMIPVVIGAVAPVLGMVRVTRRATSRVVGVVVTAAFLGITAATVLHLVTGTLSGDAFSFFLDSSVLAAMFGAGALVLLGLHRIGGLVGLGIGAATLLLVGSPLSGAATAPEFLAEPWQTIGQWMPAGAGSQLLRSVSFFDGAGWVGTATVLTVWIGVGIVLSLLPTRRRVTATG